MAIAVPRAELARRAFHFDDVPASAVPAVMEKVGASEVAYAGHVDRSLAAMKAAAS